MNDCQKTDCQKTACQKTDCQNTDCKKTSCQKNECQKTDCQKTDSQKTYCQKTDSKNPDCQKSDSKRVIPEDGFHKTECKRLITNRLSGKENEYLQEKVPTYTEYQTHSVGTCSLAFSISWYTVFSYSVLWKNSLDG